MAVFLDCCCGLQFVASCQVDGIYKCASEKHGSQNIPVFTSKYKGVQDLL